MVKQYIELGADGWHILIYYGVDTYDKNEIAQILAHLGCPKRDIVRSLNTLTKLNDYYNEYFEAENYVANQSKGCYQYNYNSDAYMHPLYYLTIDGKPVDYKKISEITMQGIIDKYGLRKDQVSNSMNCIKKYDDFNKKNHFQPQ